MAQLMFKIANESPLDIRTINPEVPDKLSAVINKLLVKDVTQRYQRGSALAADLRASLA
jgi:serine/threonine-protein kinase